MRDGLDVGLHALNKKDPRYLTKNPKKPTINSYKAIGNFSAQPENHHSGSVLAGIQNFKRLDPRSKHLFTCEDGDDNNVVLVVMLNSYSYCKAHHRPFTQIQSEQLQHPLRIIKYQLGFSKALYRSLLKNDSKLAAW